MERVYSFKVYTLNKSLYDCSPPGTRTAKQSHRNAGGTAWLEDSHGQGSRSVGGIVLLGQLHARRYRDAVWNAPMGNGELPPATLLFANEKATNLVLGSNKICGFFYVPTCELERNDT